MGMGLVQAQKGRPRATPVVNVTPLVDIALVVLIILMLVTPMMTKSFWLNLPKKTEDEKPKAPDSGSKAPLVMTVDKDGVIRINKTVLKKSEIKARLPRMLAAKEQKVLYFDAHDTIPYGKAVEAMDLSRAGGARSIAVLTTNIVK